MQSAAGSEAPCGKSYFDSSQDLQDEDTTHDYPFHDSFFQLCITEYFFQKLL